MTTASLLELKTAVATVSESLDVWAIYDVAQKSVASGKSSDVVKHLATTLASTTAESGVVVLSRFHILGQARTIAFPYRVKPDQHDQICKEIQDALPAALLVDVEELTDIESKTFLDAVRGFKPVPRSRRSNSASDGHKVGGKHAVKPFGTAEVDLKERKDDHHKEHPKDFRRLSLALRVNPTIDEKALSKAFNDVASPNVDLDWLLLAYDPGKNLITVGKTGIGDVDALKAAVPPTHSAFAIIRCPFRCAGGRLKIIEITFQPDGTNLSDPTNQAILAGRLMLKQRDLFPVHHRLTVTSLDQLTSEHVELEVAKVIDTDAIMLRISTAQSIDRETKRATLFPVWLNRGSDLHALKSELHKRFGIPREEQRLYQKWVTEKVAAFGEVVTRVSELSADSKKLEQDYGLLNGDKLYLESAKPDLARARVEKRSAAQQEQDAKELGEERAFELETAIQLAPQRSRDLNRRDAKRGELKSLPLSSSETRFSGVAQAQPRSRSNSASTTLTHPAPTITPSTSSTSSSSASTTSANGVHSHTRSGSNVQVLVHAYNSGGTTTTYNSGGSGATPTGSPANKTRQLRVHRPSTDLDLHPATLASLSTATTPTVGTMGPPRSKQPSPAFNQAVTSSSLASTTTAATSSTQATLPPPALTAGNSSSDSTRATTRSPTNTTVHTVHTAGSQPTTPSNNTVTTSVPTQMSTAQQRAAQWSGTAAATATTTSTAAGSVGSAASTTTATTTATVTGATPRVGRAGSRDAGNAAVPPAAVQGQASSAAQTTTTTSATTTGDTKDVKDTKSAGQDGKDGKIKDARLGDPGEDWEINPEDILVVKRDVGRGKTARVHKGIWGCAEVAFKELQYHKLTDMVAKSFREEVQTLTKLRHPNVVVLVGVCTHPQKLSIITEWLPRGALHDILWDKTITLNCRDVIRMALDVAEGMAYLHSQHIIHRDLKSHNLLVDESWTVKVADFGYAKHLSENALELAVSQLGTAGWVAPEVLEGQDGYRTAPDVFSYGVCLWEMLARGVPNEMSGIPPSKYAEQIRAGKANKLPSFCPKQLAELIQKCWDFYPQRRPTFDEIVEILKGLMSQKSLMEEWAKINVPCVASKS